MGSCAALTIGDMTELSVRPIEILLVEDNPADVRLTIEALREDKLANAMHVARDGVEALDYLRRQAEFGDAARPDLVLLDLDLPRKDGRQVLAEIREDPDLADIPVVVLTTSAQHDDMVASFNLRADSYFTKPIDVTQLVSLVGKLEGFWLSIVRFGDS